MNEIKMLKYSESLLAPLSEEIIVYFSILFSYLYHNLRQHASKLALETKKKGLCLGY